MGFEPTTTSLGSGLDKYATRYTATRYATGSQQHHTVPVTARYRPRQHDTGGTVTETGMSRWNRDKNRNRKILGRKNFSPLLTRETTPGLVRQAGCPNGVL